MTHISLPLMALGVGCLLSGGIWLVVEGFKASARWGVAMILMNFVSLGFVITHWSQAKRPFLIQLLGVGLFVAGMMMAEKPGPAL